MICCKYFGFVQGFAGHRSQNNAAIIKRTPIYGKLIQIVGRRPFHRFDNSGRSDLFAVSAHFDGAVQYLTVWNDKFGRDARWFKFGRGAAQELQSLREFGVI